MKKFIVSYSGAVDLEAETEKEALETFFNMTNEELGATIEEYEGIEERESKSAGVPDAVEKSMKINEDNYLSLVIENLEMLKDAFADDVIPPMIFDGDEEEKITELQNLVDYLQKTN